MPLCDNPGPRHAGGALAVCVSGATTGIIDHIRLIGACTVIFLTTANILVADDFLCE